MKEPEAADECSPKGCTAKRRSHGLKIALYLAGSQIGSSMAMESGQNCPQDHLFSINLQGLMAVILLLRKEHTRFLSRLMNAPRRIRGWDLGGE